MNETDLRTYLKNVQLLRLKRDPLAFKLEGPELIFTDHQAYNRDTLSILTAYLQQHPHMQEELTSRMRSPEQFNKDMKRWFAHLPSTEALHREQEEIRGSKGHYPHGKQVYQALHALDHLVRHPGTFPREKVLFGHIPVPDGNVDYLQTMLAVVLEKGTEIPESYKFSFMNDMFSLRHLAIDHTHPLATSTSIPTTISISRATKECSDIEFNIGIAAYDEGGAITLRDLPIAYDRSVKHSLLDSMSSPYNPLAKRFERKNVGELVHTLEMGDYEKLLLLHEEGHQVQVSDEFNRYRQVTLISELIAELHLAKTILDSPAHKHLRTAKEMDMYARASCDEATIAEAILPAYKTNNPAAYLERKIKKCGQIFDTGETALHHYLHALYLN